MIYELAAFHLNGDVFTSLSESESVVNRFIKNHMRDSSRIIMHITDGPKSFQYTVYRKSMVGARLMNIDKLPEVVVEVVK